MTTPQRLSLLAAAAVIGLGSTGIALSDSDEHEHHNEGRESGRSVWFGQQPDIRPVDNPLYAEECGACHMAYQPGLLPAEAWQRVMSADALANHYGDDASLSDEVRTELLSWLTGNASDLASQTRSRAFGVKSPDDQASNAAGALPRITESAYFLRKHDEIPPRLVADNPDVGSFSQCNSCHRTADKGIYNEDQINIPGYGPWED